MANRRGTGLLMVWCDVPANKEAEFNRWYDDEHLDERMSVPGFLSCARYEAVKGGPKHLAVYELSPAIGTVSLSTRIKMKRSTWVRAIAETSTGELWAAYAHVNVTLNGCG